MSFLADEFPTSTPPISPVGSTGDLSSKKWNICMVCDFFFPSYGGIESHLYCLSQELLELGHKVIIVSRIYDGPLGTQRVGIRWLTGGLKVYYLPLCYMGNGASFPTFFSHFPLFRDIVIREQIQIVHGHQAFSPLTLEFLFHARTMGLATCFTDHSLFGFENTKAVLINKVLKFVLANLDHAICVSHTARENTVLRAALSPHIVSVIPNALLSSQFQPDPSQRDPDYGLKNPKPPYLYVTIVSVSRLVYNKGADLLAQVIPRVCKRFPKVRFLIAGDGNKRIDLEQMRERHILQDRVILLGSILHDQVRDVLVQGHLFLNTSLTEAFCIGIIEAASAGLHVVSTRVGGVPELLPPDMITFAASPSTRDLLEAITVALGKWASVDPHRSHERVRSMYSWQNVAVRTERVYTSVMASPRPSLVQCLVRLRHRGPVAGLLFCLCFIMDVFLIHVLEWWRPTSDIEIVPSFTQEHWKRVKAMVAPEREHAASFSESRDLL